MSVEQNQARLNLDGSAHFASSLLTFCPLPFWVVIPPKISARTPSLGIVAPAARAIYAYNTRGHQPICTASTLFLVSASLLAGAGRVV